MLFLARDYPFLKIQHSLPLVGLECILITLCYFLLLFCCFMMLNLHFITCCLLKLVAVFQGQRLVLHSGSTSQGWYIFFLLVRSDNPTETWTQGSWVAHFSPVSYPFLSCILLPAKLLYQVSYQGLTTKEFENMGNGHCCSFISEAMIKYPDKKQCRGGKGSFGLQFQARAYHFSEVKAVTSVSSHITPWKQIYPGFPLAFSCLIIQEPQPRKQYHPQWAGSSYIIQQLSQSPVGMPTHQPDSLLRLLSKLEG